MAIKPSKPYAGRQRPALSRYLLPLLAIAAAALVMAQLLFSHTHALDHEVQDITYAGYVIMVVVVSRYLSRRVAVTAAAALALVYTLAFIPHFLAMGTESHKSFIQLGGRPAFLVVLAVVLSSFRVGLAREKQKALKAERDRSGRLRLMLAVSSAVSSSLELEEVLQVLAEKTATTVKATYCRVLLLGDGDAAGYLRVAAAYPIRVMEWDAAIGATLPLAELPDYEKAIENQEAVVVNAEEKAETEALPTGEKKLLGGARHQLLYPLVVDGATVGVMCVGEQRRRARRPLDTETAATCQTIANVGAIAVGNALAHRAREEAFAGTVRSLAQAVDAKDKYTHGHSERVAQHAVMIASRLGLNSSALEVVAFAGSLHDVGKIGISEDILQSRDRLSASEWKEIKKHPVMSTRILAPAGLSREVSAAVYHHHERWDGRGYPEGISGEAIPLVARILAVADAYEAMTSDRPYRGALSREEAVTEIRRGSGTHFDPAVVEAFLGYIDEAEPPAAEAAS